MKMYVQVVPKGYRGFGDISLDYVVQGKHQSADLRLEEAKDLIRDLEAVVWHLENEDKATENDKIPVQESATEKLSPEKNPENPQEKISFYDVYEAYHKRREKCFCGNVLKKQEDKSAPSAAVQKSFRSGHLSIVRNET